MDSYSVMYVNLGILQISESIYISFMHVGTFSYFQEAGDTRLQKVTIIKEEIVHYQKNH